MRKRYISWALIFLLALLAIGAWRITDNKEVHRAEFLMGTYMEITAIGRRAPAAMAAAFERIQEIEARMTHHGQSSEIAIVNDKAGQTAAPVGADTYQVVKKALRYADLTQGKFDPTILPIVNLWQIGSPQARVPQPYEIESSLPAVGYKGVLLDDTHKTIKLAHAGMGLDLGAIAKGYAADEVAAIFRQHGVKKALINLGGNLYALGNNPAGKPWRIGIQDPESNRNEYMAVVEVDDETLVTSGAYERFLEADGVLYHHILDPFTGYPAESDLLSVTIIGKSSIDADALSTSVFVLGLQEGLKLLNETDNTNFVLIDKDLQVYCSAGAGDRFTITNPKYQLAP